MKTVKEWFELIKDEKIRKEALENMNLDWSEKECECVNEAIADGFFWGDSRQGFQYWDEIYEKNIELLEESHHQ